MYKTTEKETLYSNTNKYDIITTSKKTHNGPKISIQVHSSIIPYHLFLLKKKPIKSTPTKTYLNQNQIKIFPISIILTCYYPNQK